MSLEETFSATYAKLKLYQKENGFQLWCICKLIQILVLGNVFSGMILGSKPKRIRY